MIMIAEPARNDSTDGGGNDDAAAVLTVVVVVLTVVVEERPTAAAAVTTAGGMTGASTERARAREFGWATLGSAADGQRSVWRACMYEGSGDRPRRPGCSRRCRGWRTVL